MQNRMIFAGKLKDGRNVVVVQDDIHTEVIEVIKNMDTLNFVGDQYATLIECGSDYFVSFDGLYELVGDSLGQVKVIVESQLRHLGVWNEVKGHIA